LLRINNHKDTKEYKEYRENTMSDFIERRELVNKNQIDSNSTDYYFSYSDIVLECVYVTPSGNRIDCCIAGHGNRVTQYSFSYRPSSGNYVLLYNSETARTRLYYANNTRVAQDNSDPSIIYPTIQDKECMICCEKREMLVLDCGHEVCGSCILKTSLENSKKCPYCRQMFQIPDMIIRDYCSGLERKVGRQNNVISTYRNDVHLIEDELADIQQRENSLESTIRYLYNYVIYNSLSQDDIIPPNIMNIINKHSVYPIPLVIHYLTATKHVNITAGLMKKINQLVTTNVDTIRCIMNEINTRVHSSTLETFLQEQIAVAPFPQQTVSPVRTTDMLNDIIQTALDAIETDLQRIQSN
jgi:hypothetical protein